MSIAGKWDINLGRVKSKIGEAVKEKTVRIAKFLFTEIVNGTPVYTGQLRASWNISAQLPNYTTVDSGGAKGSPLPPPGFVNLTNLPDYPTIFICNGKPYASIIEYGTAKAAPAATVRLAIARLK